MGGEGGEEAGERGVGKGRHGERPARLGWGRGGEKLCGVVKN